MILKRKLEDRSRIGTPRLGSPAPGNSPRVAASAQGSPLRGMPSQGALSSPQGSPSTSAAFSPGSLAAAASESLESDSVASPAQSSPERAYSDQMTKRAGEAANAAGSGIEEDEEQSMQSLQVRQCLCPIISKILICNSTPWHLLELAIQKCQWAQRQSSCVALLPYLKRAPGTCMACALSRQALESSRLVPKL